MARHPNPFATIPTLATLKKRGRGRPTKAFSPTPPANPFAHVPSLAEIQHRGGPLTPSFSPTLPSYHGVGGGPLLAPPAAAGALPTIASLTDIAPPSPNLYAQEAATGALSPPDAFAQYLHAANRALPGRAENRELANAIQRIGIESQPENLGEPADLTNLALLAGGGLGVRALKGAVAAGEAAAGAGEAGAAASQAAEASRLAKVAQGVGSVASAPLRHPALTAASPVAAEVPGAIRSGNPEQLLHGLSGAGVLASVLGGAGGDVRGALPNVAGNALGDLVELPAQVLPSVYLPLQAGVQAAQGHPEHLTALRQGFQDTSPLAALAHGDLGAAGARAVAHPLYAALEATAAKAALGHGVTGLQRVLGVDSAAAGVRRPDLNVYDQVNEQRGPYSPDYFTRRRQLRQDARRPVANAETGALQATQAEIGNYLRSVADRGVYGGEVVRKGEQRRGQAELHGARPRGAGDRVASLQLQGIISPDPHQALVDLASYRRDLIEQQPHLHPSELKANRQLVKDIGKAIKGGPLDTTDLVTRFLQLQDPVDAGLMDANLLDPKQAAERKAGPYARRHMDSTYGLSNETQRKVAEILENGDGFTRAGELSRLRARRQRLDSQGNPLPLEDVHAHMRANGFDPDRIGYVTQSLAREEGTAAPPATSYAPPNRMATLPNKKFSGEATTRGTFDASLEGLLNSWTGQRTAVDRILNFRRIMDRIGLKAPGGKTFDNAQQARLFIEHPEDFGASLPDIPGGWQPVRLAPFPSKAEVADALGDVGKNRAQDVGMEPEALMDDVEGGELMRKALAKAREPGDGPVILAPKLVMDRLDAHFQKLTTGEKAAQAVTGAFKGAVLPTSITWFAGNAIDNLIIRTLGTGLGVSDNIAGRGFAKLIQDELKDHPDPTHAAYAIESIMSGGHYGSQRRIQPYRGAQQFETSRLRPLADAIHRVLEAPGSKQVADAYRTYRDAVFDFDSRFVEQTGQWAQLSKTARKELGMSRGEFRRAVAAGEPAVRDLARGFRNPDTIDRYARSVERVFGNWGKNGPEARRFLTTWAPFWQWARAATKFAFVTLPKDHPVLTGLVAAAEQMTREEREALGFSFDAAEPLPTYLQGSIPDPFQPGGVARLTNLTTFGSFADPTQFYGANFVPAVLQGSYLAALGLDWKGDKLVSADGTPASIQEKAKAALFGTVDSFIPFLNSGRSIASKGVAEGLNPIRRYGADSVQSQREPRQDISVPVTDSGAGSSSDPFSAAIQAQSAESGNPFVEALEAQSSSSGNPFVEALE